MKINKLCLLLLPLLTLTSCGAKTLTEEETRQLVASFSANNEEAVEEVKGYTLTNVLDYRTSIKEENKTSESESYNKVVVKFDSENYRYYSEQVVRYENSTSPESNSSISVKEWLYFEEDTSNFVYAIDAKNNDEHMKTYIKIPSIKELFFEIYDSYIQSSTELLEKEDFTNEDTLEQILALFETITGNTNSTLIAKSKGEGHLEVNFSTFVETDTESVYSKESIDSKVVFENYLFAKNSYDVTAHEEDKSLNIITDSSLSVDTTLSTKCSIKLPNLDNF